MYSLVASAIHKLDEIAIHHTEKLWKLAKQVQEAVERTVEEYDETLIAWNKMDKQSIVSQTL